MRSIQPAVNSTAHKCKYMYLYFYMHFDLSYRAFVTFGTVKLIRYLDSLITPWCQYSNYNLIFWYAKLMNFCFNFFFCVHIFSLLLSGWLNTHYAEKIFIGPLIRTKLKLYASLALAGLQELFEFSALQCICFIEHKYIGWLFLDKWTT